MRELIAILTDGMDDGSQDFRATETVDYTPADGEQFSFPSARLVPVRADELSAYLASPQAHPLIKAAVAQAYMMILRPFPEGNERLGRLLSSMILLRAGYTFFSDVSLSALIARRSYGYYEAMANILREENGGDLTYFLEYFLELLSRAVDERRLQTARREEKARQAERELAKTPLAPVPSPPTPSPDDDTRGHGDPMGEAEPDLSAFQTVAFADNPESGGEPTAARTPMELLKEYAQDQTRIIGRICAHLIVRMDTGELTFTTTELSEVLNIFPSQFGGCIRQLKERGIILLERVDSQHNRYKVCTEEESRALLSPPPVHVEVEMESYDQDVLILIDELERSISCKDKRIGRLLRECLSKGEIAVDDYDAIGESSKWINDMQLASQLGLVEKATPQRYTILRHLKSGAPNLSKGQKRIITEMYETFGDEVFSTDMVIATLDYNDANARAYLHIFTLLKVLDCRKEDVYRYQFLINPEEHPEYFERAA